MPCLRNSRERRLPWQRRSLVPNPPPSPGDVAQRSSTKVLLADLLESLDGAQHLFLAQTIYLWVPIVKTVVNARKLYFLRNIWNTCSLFKPSFTPCEPSTGSIHETLAVSCRVHAQPPEKRHHSPPSPPNRVLPSSQGL